MGIIAFTGPTNFNTKASLRLAAGFDYNFTDDTNVPTINFATDLIFGLYFFRDKKFNPYIICGAGYPRLFGLGLGVAANLSERIFVFGEAYGSVVPIYRGTIDGRVGVMFKF